MFCKISCRLYYADILLPCLHIKYKVFVVWSGSSGQPNHYYIAFMRLSIKVMPFPISFFFFTRNCCKLNGKPFIRAINLPLIILGFCIDLSLSSIFVSFSRHFSPFSSFFQLKKDEKNCIENAVPCTTGWNAYLFSQFFCCL